MFVADAGPGWLNVDCVLDFGEHGHIPVMLAVGLPENPSLALFERELIAQWVGDGRHVDATLTVGPAGSRLTLGSGGTDVILQVRTAESGAYRG